MITILLHRYGATALLQGHGTRENDTTKYVNILSAANNEFINKLCLSARGLKVKPFWIYVAINYLEQQTKQRTESKSNVRLKIGFIPRLLIAGN